MSRRIADAATGVLFTLTELMTPVARADVATRPRAEPTAVELPVPRVSIAPGLVRPKRGSLDPSDSPAARAVAAGVRQGARPTTGAPLREPGAPSLARAVAARHALAQPALARQAARMTEEARAVPGGLPPGFLARIDRIAHTSPIGLRDVRGLIRAAQSGPHLRLKQEAIVGLRLDTPSARFNPAAGRRLDGYVRAEVVPLLPHRLTALVQHAVKAKGRARPLADVAKARVIIAEAQHNARPNASRYFVRQAVLAHRDRFDPAALEALEDFAHIPHLPSAFVDELRAAFDPDHHVDAAEVSNLVASAASGDWAAQKADALRSFLAEHEDALSLDARAIAVQSGNLPALEPLRASALSMTNPNVAIYGPHAQLRYPGDDLDRLGFLLGSGSVSSWSVAQWHLPDEDALAPADVASHSDETLGVPLYDLQSPGQSQRLAVYADPLQDPAEGQGYVWELETRRGVNSASGGHNTFLFNQLSRPIPVTDAEKISLSYRVVDVNVSKMTSFDAANVAQSFVGMIFLNPKNNHVIFVQKMIFESNGTAYDDHFEAGVQQALHSTPLGDGLISEGRAWHHGEIHPAKDLAEVLGRTYYRSDGTPVGFVGDQVGDYVLGSLYFGNETAGPDTRVTLQVKRFQSSPE